MLTHCYNRGIADDPDIPDHPVQNAEQIGRGHQRISGHAEMPGFGWAAPVSPTAGFLTARGRVPRGDDLSIANRASGLRARQIQTGVAKQYRYIELLDRRARPRCRPPRTPRSCADRLR